MNEPTGGLKLRTRRLTQLAGIAVLGLALLATACGSSSSKSTTATTSAGTAAPTATTTPSAATTVTTTPAATTTADSLFTYTGESPPTTGPKAATGKTVWLVSCGQAASGCANSTAAIKAAAEAIGWKANVCDGAFDTNNGYGNCITQGLAAHASAILLVSGIDCDLVAPALREAKAQHVPVVASESFDCNDPGNTSTGPPLYTASLLFSKQYPDFGKWLYARAEEEAKYIISKTDGKAKIIDENFVGQLLGTYQQDGFVAGLKSCSGCQIVDSVHVNNAILGAGQDKQLMAAAAVQHPDANVITYAFSSMLQTSQLQSVVTTMGHSVLVVGGEGQPANLDSIRSGSAVPTAEIAYNGTQLGWALIDETNRVFAGQPAVPEGIGWAIVDKTHNTGAKGQFYATPFDFEAIYRASWGVSG